MIDKYARFFKTLGEPTRIKILKMLAEKELCVCELMNILDMNQPRISQHLKVLKDTGLVKERKQAQWSYYSLCRDDFNHVMEAFRAFLYNDGEDNNEGESLKPQ